MSIADTLIILGVCCCLYNMQPMINTACNISMLLFLLLIYQIAVVPVVEITDAAVASAYGY